MSEEYKEVEQTESEAEPTESGADKETENVADKEAEQTGAEMEAVKETDQTETQEIETKDQPEVSITRCSWFVRIYTWNYKNFIFDLFCNLCQSVLIVAYSIFVISGTWTNYKYKSLVFSGKNFSDLFISFCFNVFEFL